MKKRVVPIYGVTVYFTNDPEEARAFFKAHEAEEESDKKIGLNGGVYVAFEDNSDKTWRLMCVFDGMDSYVAHESFHAAIELSEYLGINIDSKNSEPVCYLAQWFFETMLKLFPDKPKGPVLQEIA